MPERPDLRQIALSISDALEGFERDDLAKMLTYVFKEYVVEGAPPVLVSQVDGIDALEGLSFAALIEQLQARLDIPELEHFSVDGERVSVRVGGVMTPIGGDARNPRTAPATLMSAPPAANPPERPAAAEAIARGRGDLTGGQRSAPSSAPAPSRGLSIGSRPMAGGGATPQAASPSSPAPATTPEPGTDAPEPDGEAKKPAPGDDDASVRFSLLELD